MSLPGADPIRTFPDRASAEAAAREMEWDLRRRVNPFRCGGPRLHYQTAFDAARLFDRCLDHGLDPPGVTPDSGVWASWWDAHRDGFTNLQRAAIWEVLDRVRFFRVVESEPAVPMHLVVLPHFENDPIPSRDWPEPYVGCTPYMLVRSQATADGLCQRLVVDRLIETGEFVGGNLERASWSIPDVDPFGPDEPWPLYPDAPVYYAEHRPLGLTGDQPPTPGREVFVVLRRGWRVEEGATGTFIRWSPTHARTCGRPVAAFGTQPAADAHMARLEAEARQAPSSFRFGTPHEWGALDASAIYGTLWNMFPINFTNQWTDYKASDQAWADWWDEAVPHLSAEQVETAWSLFENLRFYEVVAVEFRE